MIEVVIGIGLMSILMMALVQMQTSQMTENRSLGEQLASLDLHRELIQVFSLNGPGSVCSGIMTSPVQTFSAPSAYPVESVFSIDKIPVNLSAGAPLIAQVGHSVGQSNSLKVQTIRVDLVAAPILGVFPAHLIITFDASLTVRKVKDLKLPIYLQTSGTGPFTVIGCGGSVGGPTLFSGVGCASCPYGSYSSTGLTSSCALKDSTGVLLKPGAIGGAVGASSTGVCAAGTSAVPNSWAMWSY